MSGTRNAYSTRQATELAASSTWWPLSTCPWEMPTPAGRERCGPNPRASRSSDSSGRRRITRRQSRRNSGLNTSASSGCAALNASQRRRMAALPARTALPESGMLLMTGSATRRADHLGRIWHRGRTGWQARQATRKASMATLAATALHPIRDARLRCGHQPMGRCTHRPGRTSRHGQRTVPRTTISRASIWAGRDDGGTPPPQSSLVDAFRPCGLGKLVDGQAWSVCATPTEVR